MLFPAARLLELVTAQAALLVVRAGASQDCPSGIQVSDALGARLPGAVVDASGPVPPAVHPYAVELAGSPGKLVVAIVDPTGTRRLERVLSPAETGEQDCAALAETVAIIVERYLAELGLETGARSPPPPVVATVVARASAPAAVVAGPGHGLFEIALGPEGRSGYAGPSAFGLYVEGRRYLRAPFVAVRVGGFAPSSLAWSGRPGNGSLYGGRAELQVGLQRTLGAGQIDVVGAFALDLLFVQEGRDPTSGFAGREHLGLGQDVSIGAAYTRRFGPALFARLAVAGHLAITRHVIVSEGQTVTGGGELLVETPRVFATLGLGIGVAF